MAWLKNLLSDEPVGKVEQEGDHSYSVILKGRISTGDQLDPIWSKISAEQPQVTLDLGDVDSLGSSAIGSLLRFANGLYQRGGLVSIVRCPNNILLSLGNNLEIEQGLPIRSVRVDFLCRACDNCIDVDFDLTPSLVKDMTKARICKCGSEFELDVLLFPYEGLQGLVQTMATAPEVSQEPGEAPDLTGAMLQGEFEILEVIGTGGFSTVYKARQVGIDRFVAVKVMSHTTPSMAARFRDEAKAISQLAHPNVVTVFSIGELSEDSLYLAMELVQGPTLRRVLSAGPVRPLVRLLQLAREALLGVNAAHEEGIVHRDIKPENLMLASSQGREILKVLDFGLATTVTTGSADGPEGSLSGTPAYFAPEFWIGIPASEASDQFALGLVLKEMLMGSMLTRAKSDLHSNAGPPASTGYDDAAAQLLDPILARMMDVDPENRFPNLLTIIEELDEILVIAGGGPAVAYVPAKRESHRSRLWLVGPSQATIAYSQEVVCHSADVSEPSHAAFDQVVLNVSDGNWQTSWREVQRHVRPNVVLPVIAGAVDGSAASAVGNTNQGVLGVDSGIASILLESMASEGTISPGELLTPGGKYLQLTSLEHKQLYLSILEESLTAGRVRSTIRHRIVQLADELILNAFYYSDSQRKTTRPMRFPTGRAGLLRWLIRDDDVVISVRDAYGSLRAFDLIRSLQSLHAPKRPKVREVGGIGVGMGMGIPMTINSSKAVVFQVLSGERTEVCAVFDKERLSDPSGKHCVGWMFRNKEHVPPPRGKRITTIGEGLWYEESPTEEGLRILLRGHVGESTNLFKVFNHQGTVILDLGQVTGINSFGVRNWCAAHEQRSPFLKLEIFNCAPTLLDTYSLVGEIFIRASEIRSVIVPFICDRCDIEISEAMTVETLSSSLLHQPTPLRYCPSCGDVLTLDRMPESYFRFSQPS